MEIKVIDNHPFLQDAEVRFLKSVDAIITSFNIEGINFSDEELREMVKQVELEVKKSTE